MGRPPDSRTHDGVERLLCLGYSNVEIARRLKKHVVTIQKVVSILYTEVGISADQAVSSRVTFALAYLGDRGILDLEELKKLEAEVEEL